VLRAGPLAVITDLGRPGQAHIGVPRSGALDRDALRLANRLVGNPEGMRVGVLLGGLELRAESNCTVAVTGRRCRRGATRGVRRRAVGSHQVVYLRAGEHLELGVPEAGLRSYLACSGGLDVPEELGSRSTDLLSGLGPAKVSDGDRLALGTAGDAPADASPVRSRATALVTVPVLLGPRTTGSLTRPVRCATRVDGRPGEQPDRAAVGRSAAGAGGRAGRPGVAQRAGAPGAVQVPPSGQPVVFLADAPTTAATRSLGWSGQRAGRLAQAARHQVRLSPR